MRPDLEARSFQLVKDSQHALADALNALGGESVPGLKEQFMFFGAVHINRAAGGYVILRDAQRLDASKLLIRPAIEALIKSLAVVKCPELLYRFAYTDRMDDRAWCCPSDPVQAAGYDITDDREWAEFEATYAEQYPTHSRVKKKLKLIDAAKMAKLDGFYQSHYRLYCKFTHGALGAMAGELDYSDSVDNRTMAGCVFGALEILHDEMCADIPQLAELQERLFGL